MLGPSPNRRICPSSGRVGCHSEVVTSSSVADGRLVERFSMTGAQLALMSVGVLPVLGFGAMLVIALRRGPAVMVVMAGVFTPLFALLAVVCLLAVLRPLTLTETALLLPRVLRSYRRIALVDVAAVGMVFVRGRRFAQWAPYVWLREGTPVRLPGRVFDFEPPPLHPGDREPSWQVIAASPAGQMCRRIREVALQQQGPYGPLAGDDVRFRDSDAGPGSRYAACAYWSPVEALGIGYPPPVR